MKNVKIFVSCLLLVAMLFCLTACTGDTANNAENSVSLESLPAYTYTQTEGFTDFTTNNNVAFVYPSDWISVGQEEQPMFVSSDGNGSSITYTYETVPDYISFDGYIEMAKVQVENSVTVNGEIKTEKINLNGKEGCLLSYTSTTEEGEIELNIYQAVFMDNGTAHVITVGHRSSILDEMSSAVNTIISSFRIAG